MRPQRQPNGLVIGAETGQIRPADEGVAAAVVPPVVVELAAAAAAAAAWAARICAPSWALVARSASISDASARSFSLSAESATSWFCFVAASESRALTSAPRVSAPARHGR